MMFRSLRLRLAFWLAGLGAVTLGSSGLIAWGALRDAGQARLDTQLATQLIPNTFIHAGLDGGWQALDAELSNEAPSLFPGGRGRILIRVRGLDGSPVYESPDWFAALDAAVPALAHGGLLQPIRDSPVDRRRPSIVRFATAVTDGRSWRIAAATDAAIEIAIASDLGLLDGPAREEAAAFLIAIPAAMGLLALGAWLISHRALRPVRRLVDHIDQVTVVGLDRRVPSGREPREIAQIIVAFNAMLERLEHGFTQASRFSADAAHELKTPLAVLQGEIELALHRAKAGSDLQRLLSGLLDEVRRLGAISRKLLLLALADAGTLAVAAEPLALDEALDEIIEDIQTLEPDLAVSSAIEPRLEVAADPALLRQLLQNLASNAMKYNLPHGWIRIEARRRADMVEIEMSNASAAIRSAETERIFERFYRADSARNRRIDGLGLGLSLAQAIARAHRGDLVLAEAATDNTRFRLTMPGVRPT
jgi:two-component system, OmpR family, heavy metal sensor histidine kinase CusS